MKSQIFVAEQCIPARECQKYQDTLDTLGQAAFYDLFIFLNLFKILLSKCCKLYWAAILDNLDYTSPDYIELYDYITERICESGEKEDKVCCSKDDIQVF